MSWTIARADNNLYPTPPNPAVFPRSSVATVPFSTLATNFPKAVWCDFTSDSLGGGSQLVPAIEATGATVRAIHDSAVGIKAIGGVVAYHDDARASTPDGAVFVPGVAGEGLLGGNVTDLNSLATLTVMAEFAIQPGSTTDHTLFSRRSGPGATATQFTLQVDGGNRLRAFIGDGAATVALIRSAPTSVSAGVRYRAFCRFDGTAGTDATRITFWLSVYNAGTDSFPAVVQSATVVQTAGVGAALITLANANVAFGELPDTTTNVLTGLLGGAGASIRVWNSALTEAQMNAEVASSTPVIPAFLAYNFSGSTPLANLGTAGAVGDLTAGANTPIVSGDRRYFGRASAGTSRPAYDTSGVYPACVFDGTNDYFRNVARGQLEGITADAMVVHIGTLPSANAVITTLSATTARALALTYNTANTAYVARVTGSLTTDPSVAGPLAGARVLSGYRSQAGAGADLSIRSGLGAEVLLNPVTPTGATVTRCTDGASEADTPAGFAAMTQYVRLLITGVTSSTVRQQIAEICSAYAARYCGATVT